jgi:hypothetical protein
MKKERQGLLISHGGGIPPREKRKEHSMKFGRDVSPVYFELLGLAKNFEDAILWFLIWA